MLKRLTIEQQETILETAVKIFGQKGYASASISEIAKEAGVSVGVIYKYYLDKDALFLACIDHSLDLLSNTLDSVSDIGGTISDLARNLIRANQAFAHMHPHYIQMYHAITMGNGPQGASELAVKIEGQVAKIYTDIISKAKLNGTIRSDIVPGDFAFFFDNLLMLLHFSYSCEYYQTRMKLYCGTDILDEKYDKSIEDQLMKFIEGGLGIK